MDGEIQKKASGDGESKERDIYLKTSEYRPFVFIFYCYMHVILLVINDTRVVIAGIGRNSVRCSTYRRRRSLKITKLKHICTQRMIQ